MIFIKNKFREKGFTLIELLVVIAIIGLLATLAVVALGNARLKSRDAKRVSDIKQIQTALELRYVEEENYPYDGTGSTGNTALGLNATKICDDVDITAATCTNTTYMGAVPRDPSQNGAASLCTSAAETSTCDYAYDQNTSTGASSYAIYFYLEGATGGLAKGDHCASENGIADNDTCP